MKQEPARQTLHQTSLQKQRGRAQENDTHGPARLNGLVPQSLYNLAPAANLLNLVKDENRRHFSLHRERCRRTPVSLDPFRSRRQGSVCGCDMAGQFEALKQLLNGGSLPNLARTGYNLEELPLVPNRLLKIVHDRSLEWFHSH